MALTWEKFVEKLCTEAQSDALYHHPIGSIYQSLDSTSPATLFGGTWAALGGRMLIGADSTYTAGSTGGAATHTLALTEIPAHDHVLLNPSAPGQYLQALEASSATGVTHVNFGGTANIAWATPTSSKGGGQAHNNLPPYLAVYMWERTA